MEKEGSFLETGKARFYDMIFLDLGMPIKDGYEACEAIVRHYEKQLCKIKSKTGWLTDLKIVLNLYMESKNEIIQLDDIQANME